MHFRFEHEFDTDPKSYWDLFFSADYTEDLYRQLKMKEHKILDQKDEGNVLRRTVRLQPAQEVPAIFQSVIKDTSYTERDVFHRDRSAMDVVVEPLSEEQARIARSAYQRFGKGNGHPARLNMGDYFSYALARDLGEPLLFKGEDFKLTDIEIVIEPSRQKRLSEIVAAYGLAR